MDSPDLPDVVTGLDVGKTGHHTCALPAGGKRVFDRALPQDEAAVPVAVARDCGCQVAHQPGLAMRKAADIAKDTTHTKNRQLQPASPDPPRARARLRR